MRRILIALLAAFSLAACGLVERHAPRSDAELDQLFAQLKSAPDAASAAGVEQEIWEHWAQSGSPTIDILMDRASSAEDAGDYDSALAFLERACLEAPHFAEPWNRRAAIAHRQREYRAAISAIEEALKREPRHFAAYAGLGLILEEVNRPREALDAYRAALAIHPHYEPALQGARRLEPRVEGRDA